MTSSIIEDDAFVRLFQRRAGLKPDGWAGKDTIAALDKAFPHAVQFSGDIPDRYLSLLAQIESGGRLYVKASTSSASGLYQFIKSTWEAEGGTWGSNMTDAFGGLRPTHDEQDERVTRFTEKNVDYLKGASIPINCATLYACHFLGAVTARRILAAPTDSRADKLAGLAAARANPSVLKNQTVGDFCTWLHDKTGDLVR